MATVAFGPYSVWSDSSVSGQGPRVLIHSENEEQPDQAVRLGNCYDVIVINHLKCWTCIG